MKRTTISVKPSGDDARSFLIDSPWLMIDGTIKKDGSVHVSRFDLRDPTEEMVSQGLGDTIAKATKAIGIKPCGGCKKRQQKLNKAFPYKNKKRD